MSKVRKGKEPVLPRSLRRLLQIVSSLTGKVRSDIRQYPPDSPPKFVSAFWFAKAAKSYDAAVLLWREGYWQDAAMIGRARFSMLPFRQSSSSETRSRVPSCSSATL